MDCDSITYHRRGSSRFLSSSLKSRFSSNINVTVLAQLDQVMGSYMKNLGYQPTLSTQKAKVPRHCRLAFRAVYFRLVAYSTLMNVGLLLELVLRLEGAGRIMLVQQLVR